MDINIRYLVIIHMNCVYNLVSSYERDIVQILIENFVGWTNLKTGHPIGLVCIDSIQVALWLY